MDARSHTSIPATINIVKLSQILLEKTLGKKSGEGNEYIKTILLLLASGKTMSALYLGSGSARNFLPILERQPEWNIWKHIPIKTLRRALKRLVQQQDIQVVGNDASRTITLTQHGIQKVLRYSLDTMTIPKLKRWDGIWRLVLYDVPQDKKTLGDTIRHHLQTLGFYPIQKSVYLYPYPCFQEIAYIRELYGVKQLVQCMEIRHIEEDQKYKTYFHLS